MKLDPLFGFLGLVQRFQTIDRGLMRPGEERLENDVEHSYQLAMTAWYLNASQEFGLDTDLLLRYALVHDLVEVYAGDTPAFTRDASHRDSKQDREAAAAARLASEFPDFVEMHETIRAYEALADRESRFVYALDKLLPVVGNYLDQGRNWHREGVTLEMLRAYKTEKIAKSPEVDAYFQELLALLEQRPGLFPYLAGK